MDTPSVPEAQIGAPGPSAPSARRVVVCDKDLAVAWRGLVARWSAIPEPDSEEENPYFDPRATIEKKLLASEAGRRFLTASLNDGAEVVRLAAAAALLDTGSAAARRVLEVLAGAHSPNAVSARIILGRGIAR